MDQQYIPTLLYYYNALSSHTASRITHHFLTIARHFIKIILNIHGHTQRAAENWYGGFTPPEPQAWEPRISAIRSIKTPVLAARWLDFAAPHARYGGVPRRQNDSAAGFPRILQTCRNICRFPEMYRAPNLRRGPGAHVVREVHLRRGLHKT